MPTGLRFEDFRTGQEFTTDARLLTGADIDAFAALSGDRNPLHTDEDYARGTLFGGRIAHGILGLAVASGLLNQTGLTRGTLLALVSVTWEFVRPVRPETRLQASLRVDALRASRRADRGVVTLGVTLRDASGEELQRGQFVLLVRRGAPPTDVPSSGDRSVDRAD